MPSATFAAAPHGPIAPNPFNNIDLDEATAFIQVATSISPALQHLQKRRIPYKTASIPSFSKVVAILGRRRASVRSHRHRRLESNGSAFHGTWNDCSDVYFARATKPTQRGDLAGDRVSTRAQPAAEAWRPILYLAAKTQMSSTNEAFAKVCRFLSIAVLSCLLGTAGIWLYYNRAEILNRGPSAEKNGTWFTRWAGVDATKLKDHGTGELFDEQPFAPTNFEFDPEMLRQVHRPFEFQSTSGNR